ncbi:MAG: entericidin A/B family lipoprotein [Planctomycetota bacterium]|nr:MAG: entericidin A/B family lipoprotein [Planctomycetota bacterium]
MLGASGAMLTACNTTEGVGEDIEAAGDAISDTARDAKD